MEREDTTDIPSLYTAFSHAPVRAAGNDVDLSIYREAGETTYGVFKYNDQPRFVADTIVNFIRRVKGRESMADINLGNQGIWKGDERLMIEELRAIHGTKV